MLLSEVLRPAGRGAESSSCGSAILCREALGSPALGACAQTLQTGFPRLAANRRLPTLPSCGLPIQKFSTQLAANTGLPTFHCRGHAIHRCVTRFAANSRFSTLPSSGVLVHGYEANSRLVLSL